MRRLTRAVLTGRFLLRGSENGSSPLWRAVRRWFLAAAALLGSASPAFAQHQHNMPGMPGMEPKWTATFEAQAFLNLNVQERKFTDFHQVELPNWFMAAAGRGVRGGTLTATSMFSLEPYTLRDIGSAQVFQAGETYQNLPLIDYQHPHDLVMAAGAAYEWPAMGTTKIRFEADLVGAPALGPTPFMHRASAEANPTAPLSHHHLDATHISHGVLTAGLTHGSLTIEASAFHGREPDEDRIKVEFGPLDSYSARLSWKHGPWQAQASAGHLKFPDPTEFTDVNRFTGSFGYSGSWHGRPLEALVAVGVNREVHLDITSPAFLVEATWSVTARDKTYARTELVDQDILTAGGYDPPGFLHPHVLSRVGALTAGYERQLFHGRLGHVGAGADATVYLTPPNLIESYGHPFSAHFFLRYRFGAM